MEDQEARELYVRMRTLHEQSKQLERHAEEIDDKTVELRRMIDAVIESQSLSDGDEILVPLANGIFLPARAEQVRRLVLNVGADTTITKTPEETISMLEKQQEELAAYRQKVLVQQEQVQSQIAMIEQRVEEH